MADLLAPCGIDCAVCDAYIATINNNTDLFNKLAEDYKKNLGKDIDPQDLRCDGCPSDGRHIGFCAVCEIRACAQEKNYKTCAECDDFPCLKGSFIWKPGSQSKAALESIRHPS